jgi:hypothetical protein
MKHVAIVVCLIAGCVDTQPPITGTTSLKVDLIAPADPGGPMNRISSTLRTVTFAVTAFDADGKLDASYTKQAQVYVHYLGTLTPPLGASPPLATFQITAGKSTNQTITLPQVFGPTTLWIDDGASSSPTYATGISPTLWYRDPFIYDIQTPPDETSADALYVSPLQGKNISLHQSRYGARGRLVVTSAFSQGYTVADVQCVDANGAPPCTSQDYDYLEVFSYSAARDQDKRFIQEGQLIDGFAGGVSEFDGLTEIGFPQTFSMGEPNINKAREPAPVVMDQTWFQNPIKFERNEGGAIEIDNAKVCNIDADYTKFKQWKLDLSGGGMNCPRYVNIITAGVVNIDPTTLQNKTIPKLIGILRPLSIGTFNVFILYPRSINDITLN